MHVNEYAGRPGFCSDLISGQRIATPLGHGRRSPMHCLQTTCFACLLSRSMDTAVHLFAHGRSKGIQVRVYETPEPGKITILLAA